MNFRASFCDPFKADIIALGEIDRNEIINKFKSIPWKEYLDRMSKVQPREIHFSPSLEIENRENRNGITISAVDDERGGVEYYIFFKRPKHVKRLFGLLTSLNNDYMTQAVGQTEEDVIRCLTALIDNDLNYLESL